jgi:predicted Zn finger-like uncharacterized protein
MAISVSCPHCKRPYQLSDGQAGKTVKCKQCGKAFTVPNLLEPAVERSGGGEPVYRPAPKTSSGKLAKSATPFFDQITRHLETTIGPSSMVFHELISPDIHIDLHFIPPINQPAGNDHPFGTDHYTVVTSGLSSHPMTLRPGAPADLRYAELMIALPPDWPGMQPDGSFDSQVMKDDTNWWPMRWLKTIARLPHSHNTYLATGVTIPTADPAVPFAVNTELCCMLVLTPLLSPKSRKLIVNDDITINFYALWPLYLEEMNLKLEKGFDALIDALGSGGVRNELIQIDRKNTCRKKSGWRPW